MGNKKHENKKTNNNLGETKENKKEPVNFDEMSTTEIIRYFRDTRR